MEGIGAAANIIAVVDLSAKVASQCYRYYREVESARTEIKRLQNEVETLKTTLEGAQKLLVSAVGARLPTSQPLKDGVDSCFAELEAMNQKLDGKLRGKQKLMHTFGVRALKWPFERKEVDRVIKTLEQFRQTLTACLTIDQSGQVFDIAQSTTLSKIPTAKGAAFDSYEDEQDARCHPETRIDLLHEITKWSDTPSSQCIFWLQGMAGTGKSTISRTVAQTFHAKKELGASFFFKRGERGRGSASLLFPTIATQLVAWEPGLRSHLAAAMEADPSLPGKTLRDQFEHLILGILRHVPTPRKAVLVIDALDECDRENDARTIISLLAQVKTLPIPIRVFLTSRPELPIRLGFISIKGNYQDIALHEIPAPTIEHDIRVFLETKLAHIREEHNATTEEPLPADWPGTAMVQQLVQMAVPLFIFAATVCRFIGDLAGQDPRAQLSRILEYRTTESELDKLDATYRPVLDQLIVGKNVRARSRLINEFRTVVGSIVLLVEPLSRTVLSRLLDVSSSTIESGLKSLHSVLSVPSSPDDSIRPFHLSFHDFLVDPTKRESNPFWVDERHVHEKLAMRCVKILESNLKKDICNLQKPGSLRAEMNMQTISAISAEVRYACLYWVYHLQESDAKIDDTHWVFRFLQIHLLHWFEALSLLGEAYKIIGRLRALQGCVREDLLLSTYAIEHRPSPSSDVSAFLKDTSRFVLRYCYIMDVAPLQLYVSGIVFAPSSSWILKLFKDQYPGWVVPRPAVDATWDTCLQTLDGHDAAVKALAFSPDRRILASASNDATVRLWDLETGELQQILHHVESVLDVTFDLDGGTVISASADGRIRSWDVSTGEMCQELQLSCVTTRADHMRFSRAGKLLAIQQYKDICVVDSTTGMARVQTKISRHSPMWGVCFDITSEMLAVANNTSIVLWDTTTGRLRHELMDDRVSGEARDVAFAPDGQTLAVARPSSIALWDTNTKALQRVIPCDTSFWARLAFTADSSLLAMSLEDNLICCWSVETGEHLGTIGQHHGLLGALVFSPRDRTIASTEVFDGRIQLWEVAKGLSVDSDPEAIRAIAVAWDGTVATGSKAGTLHFWDSISGTTQKTVSSHQSRIERVKVSPDGTILASISTDAVVLWDTKTGSSPILQINRCWLGAHHFAFSPGSKMLVLAPEHTDSVTESFPNTASDSNTFRGSNTETYSIELWDIKTGTLQKTFEAARRPENTCFSPNGELIVSKCIPIYGQQVFKVYIWSVEEHDLRCTISIVSPFIVALSPDSRVLVTGSFRDGTVYLWDTQTGACMQTIPNMGEHLWAVAISRNGEMIASAASDAIRVRHISSGTLLATVSTSSVSSQLAFSTGGGHLKTDHGWVKLANCPSAPDEDSEVPASLLYVERNWLLRDGERALWFPPGYLPHRVVFNGRVLAIVHESGGIMFFP